MCDSKNRIFGSWYYVSRAAYVLFRPKADSRPLRGQISTYAALRAAFWAFGPGRFKVSPTPIFLHRKFLGDRVAASPHMYSFKFGKSQIFRHFLALKKGLRGGLRPPGCQICFSSKSYFWTEVLKNLRPNVWKLEFSTKIPYRSFGPDCMYGFRRKPKSSTIGSN